MSFPKEYKMLFKKDILRQKISSLVRFWNKNFTTCQILIEFFLKRVRFWIKNFTTPHFLSLKNDDAAAFEEKYVFTKHDYEEKNIFKKQDSEENYIFINQILKKLCTQKVTFSFNSPRNMHKCCVVCATSKSTILMKNFFLKSTISKEEKFLKSMILNKKVFLRSIILNQKTLVLSDFPATFHNVPDSESKILQRVIH